MRTRSGKNTHAKTENLKPSPPQQNRPSAKPKTNPKLTYEQRLREKDKTISKLKKQLDDAYEGVESPLHRKIQELLSCAICFEMLQQPYMLPTCGHTFCSECILAWGLTSDKISGVHHPVTRSLDLPFTVPCPMCRKNETHQLRKNLLVQSLVFAYAGDIDV